MEKEFYVQIIAFDGEKLIKEMGPFSEREANMVDNGVNINLNHDKYYTIIQKKYNEQPKSTLGKIYDEVEKLSSAENALFIILEFAGYDTETKYTAERLELYNSLRDLYKGLQALLSDHVETTTSLESALESSKTSVEVDAESRCPVCNDRILKKGHCYNPHCPDHRTDSRCTCGTKMTLACPDCDRISPEVPIA